MVSTLDFFFKKEMFQFRTIPTTLNSCLMFYLNFYERFDFVLNIRMILIPFLYFVISERYSSLHALSSTTRCFNSKISLFFSSGGKRKSASSFKIIFDDFMPMAKWRERLSFLLWIIGLFECFVKPYTDLNNLSHYRHLYRSFSCSVRMCVFKLQRLLNRFEQISHDTIFE